MEITKIVYQKRRFVYDKMVTTSLQMETQNMQQNKPACTQQNTHLDLHMKIRLK